MSSGEGRDMWMESKHIYVGETRIVTARNEAGNDNTAYQERNRFFYHSDHLGSAQLVTDYNGRTYERIEYTPYGESWIEWKDYSENNYVPPFRFTSKEKDMETGLYYYGARYMDAKTSRWMSADPALGEYVPTAGGDNSQLPGMGGVYNYVNMHLYHYAGNNPVKYLDPDGRTGSFPDGSPEQDAAWEKGQAAKREQLEQLNQFRDNFFNITGKTTSETIEWYNSQFPGETLTEGTLITLFGDDYDAAKRLLVDNVNLHRGLRTYLNDSTPETYAQALTLGWTEMSFFESLFHDPVNNVKMVSPDGYREGVYSRETGRINRDTSVMGTFNFCPSGISASGHKKVDVDPYTRHGN